MELLILVVVSAVFAGVVVVAHRIHAVRNWAVHPSPEYTVREQPHESAPQIADTFEKHDPAAVHTFVASYVEAKWREGFLQEEEIFQLASEAVEDEFPGTDGTVLIEESIHRIAETFELEQASWPSITDCDRLTRVFAELNKAGIVAAENFSCCNNCGHGEMLAEMEQERLSRPVRAYAFYHAQDTERAAQGDGLYIRYGDESQDEASNASIGREIFETLSEAGFVPGWNGSSSESIFVPIHWQKRRGLTPHRSQRGGDP